MHVSLAPLVPVADAELSDADIALFVAALGRVNDAAVPAPAPDGSLLAPPSGAFNATMAARLAAWSEA